jgi:hypothetical protein
MTRTPHYFTKTLCVILIGVSVTGCVRWKPEIGSPIKLTRACPFKQAPAVTEYGKDGVYAMYHYVVQGAPAEEIKAFTTDRIAHGFAVAMVTVNLNGKDTLFVRGAKAMRNQAQIDEEFNAACGAGSERVYLTHVFHQPFDPNDPAPTSVRVR